MKIMHVIASPSSGGAEIFARDLSRSMTASGHTIVIVFVSHSSDIGRDPSFEKQYLETLDKSNIAYDFVGHHARLNPLYGMYRLWKLTRRYRPNVVHNHLAYSVVFSLLLTRPALVYTYHNYKLKEPRPFFYLVDWFMDGVVGISELCRQNLATVLKRNVTRIDNGVDEKRMVTMGTIDKPDIFTIAMVGRLSEQKNYSLLIAAAAMLTDLDFQVLIAGEGPELESLNQQIQANDLSTRIVMVGNIVDIPSFLKSTDLYVLSSAWEGLPIALIEAAFCGLPVIVTDVGGCPEVVAHVQNGLVVSPDSPEEMAHAIRQMIEAPEQRSTYSKNAFQNSGIYSIDRCAKEHLELYRKLLEEQH